VIAVAGVAFAVPRLAQLPDQYRAERSIASAQRELAEVIARLGGRETLRRCRLTTNQPFRPRLAWELDIPVITLVHLVPPTLVLRHRGARYGAFGKLVRRAAKPKGPRLERILVTDRWEVYAVGSSGPGRIRTCDRRIMSPLL
jgi:hypothetical protein